LHKVYKYFDSYHHQVWYLRLSIKPVPTTSHIILCILQHKLFNKCQHPFDLFLTLILTYNQPVQVLRACLPLDKVTLNHLSLRLSLARFQHELTEQVLKRLQRSLSIHNIKDALEV